MLEAVRSVLYSSDLLCAEWARKDLTVVGIAERIAGMVLPLFENEGADDDLSPRLPPLPQPSGFL